MKDDPFWRRYWRSLGFGREVADELQFHVDLLTKDLIAGGMEPAAAAQEAARRFGDQRRVQADLETIERRRGRRMNVRLFVSELWSDIRYGARGLLKRPGFTIAAALSLGLGIGTATVVLTIVDNWLLRPLEVPAAEELVVAGASLKAFGSIPIAVVPTPALTEMAARTDLFQSVGGWYLQTVGMKLGESKSRMAFLLATTGNYFDLLRARPVLGRTYSEADDRERTQVVVLNDQAWRQQFAADPGVVGRTVMLNGLPFTVIGVLPPSFRGTEALLEVVGFVPSGAPLGEEIADLATSWKNGRNTMIARRQPGQSIGQIRAALEVMNANMVKAHPEIPDGFHLVAYPETRARPTISSTGFVPTIAAILSALAALVLAVACANVANLILARASTRATELAVRLALGASRRRLIQQLLTESMLLGLGGLLIASALGTAAVRGLSAISLNGAVPISLHLGVNPQVLLMAAAVALGAGLLSGIGPALLASRGQLHDSLRQAGRSGLSGRGRHFRGALVVGQVAVALVVLVCAGLFVQSSRRAANVDIGFQPNAVIIAHLEAKHSRYTLEQAGPIFDRVVRRVREMPGVVAADWSESMPVSGTGGGRVVDVYTGTGGGQVDRKGAQGMMTNAVGPDHFTALGLRLRAGRLFTPGDTSAAHPVVIVNQHAAEELWPGRDPVGQILRLGADAPPADVVGVVNDSRIMFLGESPKSVLYRPWAQAPTTWAHLAVRMASVDPSAPARLGEVIASVDPLLTPQGISWYDRVIHDGANGLAGIRLGATMGGVIGLLALILAVVGLYGVLTFSVTQETREIGVRLALGAEPGAIVRRVLVQGARLVGIGVVIGLAVALLVTRALGGLLIGVRPTDVEVFTFVAVGLVAVALVAAFLPARRAARMDPVGALRTDA